MTIGVLGEATDTVTEAAETVGASIVTGSTERVFDADPDAFITVGTPGLTALVDRNPRPNGPVLAVDAGPGFPEIGDARGAITALREGRPTVRHPVFGVTVGDEDAGHAALDVMVVTSGPGCISEFRVVSGEELGSVRADGVVVATPAGSHGYTRSAGGPRISPGVDAAAVVPVAAFTMSPDRWVVGLDTPVEITSKRDAPVSLLVDDERRRLSPECTVTVAAVGGIDVVVPDRTG